MIMNARNTLFLAAALSALTLPGLASAACSHTTAIRNDASTTLRLVKLKSSYSPPFFQSQWTGNRAIAPRATGTISWTSDLNCEDASGVSNVFDVKLVRQNGSTHYCERLAPSQGVRIDTPELCFKN
jgi:ABC-type sugar transport system substrate-binding protein